MNKWIIITVVIILAAGTITNGILYLQESNKLKDIQSQLSALSDDVSILQEDIQSRILALEETFSTLISVYPKLEEEFPLSIGQSILFAGEDLRLKFKGVLQDNRCPRDVVCITQGEVVCLLEVEHDGSIYNVELAQPGLYFDYSEETSNGYRYKFIVEPYPEVDFKLSNYEYRLLLTVSR